MPLKLAQELIHSWFTEHIQEKGPFEGKIKQQAVTTSHHCPSGCVELTDKVFSFRPLKAVNIRPHLPVAYHMARS